MHLHIYFFAILLGLNASLASADPLATLAKPCMNCLCSMMLLQQRRGESAAAVDRLRAHRLWTLEKPTATARLIRNFAYNQSHSPSKLSALAEHIRGIEIWEQSRFQERAAEPKLAGVVLTGADQIAAYYEGLEAMKGLLRTSMSHDRNHLFRMFKRMVGANAGGGLMFIAMLGDIFASSQGVETLIPWYASAALLAFADPVAANLPRFRGDRANDRFDQQLHTYLNSAVETQKKEWHFTSIEYRVEWFAIDAAWSGDSKFATHAFREFEYVETFGPLQKLLDRVINRVNHGTEGIIKNKNLDYGWVYLDRLLRYNEELDAPELVVTVRTIAKNPRNRAPVTDGQASFNWINGIATPVTIPVPTTR